MGGVMFFDLIYNASFLIAEARRAVRRNVTVPLTYFNETRDAFWKVTDDTDLTY